MKEWEKEEGERKLYSSRHCVSKEGELMRSDVTLNLLDANEARDGV